jgi:hypothetical protein
MPTTSDEAPFTDFVALKGFAEEHGDVSLPTINDLPQCLPTLQALWQHGSEWHFCKDHYNVYGFNIVSPTNIVQTSVDVFGDEEMRQEWAANHHSPNCGEPGWFLWASVSEFEYLFVCLDASSAHYGRVRRIVNNVGDDEKLQTSMDGILQKLLDWFRGYNQRELEECDDDDPLMNVYQNLSIE